MGLIVRLAVFRPPPCTAYANAQGAGPSRFLRERLAAVDKSPGGELEEGGARAGFAGHFLPMARPVFDAVGMSPDATSY
jgi:hypothetical protein